MEIKLVWEESVMEASKEPWDEFAVWLSLVAKCSMIGLVCPLAWWAPPAFACTVHRDGGFLVRPLSVRYMKTVDERSRILYFAGNMMNYIMKSSVRVYWNEEFVENLKEHKMTTLVLCEQTLRTNHFSTILIDLAVDRRRMNKSNRWSL